MSHLSVAAASWLDQFRRLITGPSVKHHQQNKTDKQKKKPQQLTFYFPWNFYIVYLFVCVSSVLVNIQWVIQS